jgi:hypothetical protein
MMRRRRPRTNATNVLQVDISVQVGNGKTRSGEEEMT